MTNNDILRRIRYTFDFGDSKMIALFALADHQVTREQISDWLKKEDDPAYQNCSDTLLATFLNGLIIDMRGKKEGPQPVPEKHLTNNITFTKLKIALNLKAEDILQILALNGFRISKHELSAFFVSLATNTIASVKINVCVVSSKGFNLNIAITLNQNQNFNGLRNRR